MNKGRGKKIHHKACQAEGMDRKEKKCHYEISA